MTRKLSRRNFGKALTTAATAIAALPALSGTAMAFQDGDRIESTVNLNTRHRPGTSSRVVATMAPGTVGEIMNGPVEKDGYTWWGVHWLADNIWGWSVERYLQLTDGGDPGGADFSWPIGGVITSPYGPRGSGYHYGVDIDGGDIGEPIYAARGGTAYTRYDAGGYGNYVYTTHAGGYAIEYGHLNAFEISDGQQVNRGDLIARMGNTGNSTGPHLHITIERNGSPQYIPGNSGDRVSVGDPISKDFPGID